MAYYYLTVKQVSRSSGRSSVAAMCYRTGTCAENLFDGVKHDYTRKGFVSVHETMLPPHVMEKSQSMPIPLYCGMLWN